VTQSTLKFTAVCFFLCAPLHGRQERSDDESNKQAVVDAIGPNTELIQTVGRAGPTVVTSRDLDVEWEFHRSTVAELGAKPSRRERTELLQSIVAEYLWIQRAHAFPRYHEVVTQKMISRRTKEAYPELWNDPDLSEERRAVLVRKTESVIAKEALRETIPSLSRSLEVLPEQMRTYYRRFPERFVIKEQILLSRVMLTRGLRANSEELADQIRSEAQQGEGLEVVANRLAKDSFRQLEWQAIEDSSLREEILQFAVDAEIGEISPVYSGRRADNIYELVDRRTGRTVPFEEASLSIKRIIQRNRIEGVMNEFFELEILLKAEFEPANLFDDILRRRR